jgi:hypothetical protein
MAKLGILAFGSLIDHPGWEIEEAIIARKSAIRTPFGVEFARKSRKRAGLRLLYPLIMVAIRSLSLSWTCPNRKPRTVCGGARPIALARTAIILSGEVRDPTPSSLIVMRMSVISLSY